MIGPRAGRAVSDQDIIGSICAMPHTVQFDCNNCGEQFEVAWEFGDQVQCPHCDTRFETDWETNSDDDVIGPWLAGEVE